MSREKIFIGSVIATIVALLMIAAGCSNPFAPEKRKGGVTEAPLKKATTPELLFENLSYAMNKRDIEAYEDVLDRDFWFTEPSEIDSLDFAWGLDMELKVVRRIFEKFDTFEFNFSASRRSVELGIEFPEHPDEDWEVFFGPVEMYMYDDETDEGYIVNQDMSYKLRQDEKTGIWTIIRWIDHPVGGPPPVEF